MSIETAQLLLDLGGVPGDGPVSARIDAALRLELDADARAALHLARLHAGRHLDDISHEFASSALEVLALDMGVEVQFPRPSKLLELERRFDQLPTDDRRLICTKAASRGWAGRRSVGGPSDVNPEKWPALEKFIASRERIHGIDPSSGAGDSGPGDRTAGGQGPAAPGTEPADIEEPAA